MQLFSKDELDVAAQLVHAHIPETPQFVWPQICEKVGTTVWVKHENHTQTGSFKIRGGITFIDWLKRDHPDVRGIITATRGNHGQSQARAATAAGLQAKILVPRGNSTEKNSAMRAFGGELIEFGDDFDEARVEAERLAKEEDLWIVPPFTKNWCEASLPMGLSYSQRYLISTRSMFRSGVVLVFAVWWLRVML